MSSRRLQDMSSRCLEDAFSVTIFRLPRRLKDVLRKVFKTSSRRLQDVLENVKLLRWRRSEDVFKTCLEDQRMFAGFHSAIEEAYLKGIIHKIFQFLHRFRLNKLKLFWKTSHIGQFKVTPWSIAKLILCKSHFSILNFAKTMSQLINACKLLHQCGSNISPWPC